jgi:hypothetical protein
MFGNMLIKYFIVNRPGHKKAALFGAAHTFLYPGNAYECWSFLISLMFLQLSNIFWIGSLPYT